MHFQWKYKCSFFWLKMARLAKTNVLLYIIVLMIIELQRWHNIMPICKGLVPKSNSTVIYRTQMGMNDIFNTYSWQYTKRLHSNICSEPFFIISRINITFYNHKLIMFATFANRYLHIYMIIYISNLNIYCNYNWFDIQVKWLWYGVTIVQSCCFIDNS